MTSLLGKADRSRATRSRLGAALALGAAAMAISLAGCGGGGLVGGLGKGTPNLSKSELVFLEGAGTWDLDRDGTVTCDEWKRYATQLLKENDADNDGKLNADEFKKMSRVDRLFETARISFFDKDGDGKVTVEELTERPNPAFVYLDKNKDCRLSLEERPVLASSAWTAPPEKQGAPGGGRR